MEHDGKRLRDYLNKQGYKHGAVAEKVGVHVNTVRNWFEVAEFSPNVIHKILKAYPDAAQYFADPLQLPAEIVPLSGTEYSFMNMNSHLFRYDPSALDDPTLVESEMTKEQWMQRARFYQERYFSALKRYNALLEKHISTQDALINKCKTA